jgi:hypothetical protein
MMQNAMKAEKAAKTQGTGTLRSSFGGAAI